MPKESMRSLPPEKMTKRERAARLTAYLESQRGRRPIRPAPRAARAMTRVMKPLAKKFGAGSALGANALGSQWPNIVGPRYAKLSRPLRLQGGKDGNTLIISARGPAATLLTADAAKIIAAANTFLGQGQIVRLKVVQGQLREDAPPPPPATPSARSAAPKLAAPIRRAAVPKRGLTPSEEDALYKGLENIDNDALKQALGKLGRGVLSRQT